jgi:hypothetical protein
MAKNTNKNYRIRFDWVLLCCMSGSLLLTGYALPTRALAGILHSGQLLIAKPADERIPEDVKTTLEQSAPPQAPRPANNTQQRVEPPQLPARVSSGSTTNTSSSSNSSSSESTPRQRSNTSSSTASASGESTPRRRVSTSSNSASASSESTPRRRVSTSSNSASTSGESTPRRRVSTSSSTASEPIQRTTTQPVSDQRPSSKTPKYREINFVDIAFGVLAPGDYQSQGRYFHFYQFEGNENQLIQIRLTGSADQRRSNNLSLNPLMFLLDPNNKLLATRSSTGINTQGVKDAFLFVRLPMKGTYTIAVTSQNPRSTGRYSLALRNDRASYTLDESSSLGEASQILKRNKNPYNVAKFQGKKDQLISIRADSIFEEFSPYLILLNSHGQIIASDNEKDGRYSALIDRARLPEDGTYYVVVVSAVPTERGTYRLSIF